MSASPLSTSDMTPYVAYWRRSQQQQAAYHARLARQARMAATGMATTGMATHLRQHYGVKGIILFGSLVRGDFAAGSDIDLAVEGLLKADFFRALGELNAMTHFWVDLKPLEDLEPRFRERVLSTGKEI